jgi:hypothetical protein
MKAFGIYNVERNEEAKTLRITKDSPRSRMGYKTVVNYRFKSVEALDEYFVRTWYANMEKQIEAKEAEKRALQVAKKNFVNPFKVGQVLYDSWGYDQTNIDFYQIVEVGKMSVKIRPIGQIMTRAAGFMCEYVKPAIDDFTGEESQKRVVLDSRLQPHVRGRRGWLSTFDREEIYQSHYA